MMTNDIIEEYVEKAYKYAVKNTYSRDEADELTQEIFFTAIRELPKLRDKDKFEPWFWGIAKNITKNFRRIMGKQRAMYSYDIIDLIPYEEEYVDNQEEIFDNLRKKISMLSSIYRDIIILHYYDGISTKSIAEKLKIPEGTVRWRLSEARKKLKKEYTEMTETALKPVKMRLGIYGNGNYNGKTIPFPTVYIDDALSQNILYYCYECPQSIEEIAKLCGAPSYYIEERINNLLKREAIIENPKNKYRTDFIIWSDKYGIYCEENAEKILMPIMEKLLNALNGISQETYKIDFYKAEKSENDLFYLFGAMAFEYASKHYCKLPLPQIKKKYDGNEWCYIGNMSTGKHHRIGIGIQRCENLGSRGGFNHTAYNSINGISFRQMMYDNYINVCEDILLSGETKDIDSLANAIKDGYIIKRNDGSFFVTVPFFNIKQKEKFDMIVDKYLSPLMPEYSEKVENFVSGYKKLFPKHLNDEADRMCQSIFLGLYETIIKYAQRTEKIKMPSKNCYCDVLIQFQ